MRWLLAWLTWSIMLPRRRPLQRRVSVTPWAKGAMLPAVSYYWPQSLAKRWVCPRCGGREQRDLTGLRRGVGGLLMGAGTVGLVLMAEGTWLVETWGIVVAAAILMLGLLALVGAGRARYCPTCRVRMEGFELPTDEA